MDERLRHRRPVLQQSHAVWRIDEYTCDFLFTALTTSTDINILCALPVQFFLSNPFKGENPNFTLVVSEQWFNKVVETR